MSYLVRRISRAKWDNDNFDYLANDNPPADAITSCLRTFENELSTWLINDLKELDKAILCLITGSKQENLNALQIIYFEIDEVAAKGLAIENTQGDTVIEEYRSLHYDIKNLNYTSLGSVKDIILNCLRINNYKIITKKALKDLLNESVNITKILDKSLLNEKLQKVF